LAGGETKGKTLKKETPIEAQGLLSQKLDNLLKEAKIDGEMMASLGSSIKNFESAAKGISPSIDGIAATKKYSEELSMAAAQMESLNSLYKVQLESASRNAEANKEIANNASKLKDQMQSMTANIASLNNVYGGMLSAMSNKG
jgi:gliding motility-associated protein GldL